MRFEVSERDVPTVIVDDLEAALDVLRTRHAGATQEQLGLLGLEIVKRDARGRVRRTLSSSDLVAHLLGLPIEDQDRSFTWARFDAALAVGRDFALLVTPEDERRVDGWWQLRLRYTRADASGVPIPETLYLRRSRRRRGLDPEVHEAERRLAAALESQSATPDEQVGAGVVGEGAADE